MIYALAFIVLIGILVLAHEMGHFLMGRICGVKAEAFSIGFGKPILRKKIGFTEYRLCSIPLGGYVKFFGEEDDTDKKSKKDKKEAPKKIPPELQKYSFSHQNVYKRALIVFGGPLFNFILAVILFAFVYFIGEPNIASVIGYVEKNSIAWNSGLRDGDKITAVNGERTELWADADKLISKQKNSVVLSVERGKENKNITVPLKEMLTTNKFGESVHKTGIEYIAPFKRSSLVGVGSYDNPAHNAGIKSGDLIVAIDSTEISSWNDLESYVSAHKGRLSFKVKRQEKNIYFSLSNTKDSANELGLYPAELFISGFVKQNGPAYVAGMQVGDRLVAVNGYHIESFQMLQQEVDRAGRSNRSLNIVAERGNDMLTFIILPKLHDLGDKETGSSEKRFLLGIETNFMPGPTVEKIVIIRSPLKLLWASIEKTFFWFWITLLGLIKLITGSVSLKAVGGPLMIGKVAGDSLYLGLVYFFRIMAIISINLGLINLLPVPVLDGGHLVFFTYEAIAGKPLKEKYLLIAQQVGFYILVALVVLSFYNDIIRFGSTLLSKFR